MRDEDERREAIEILFHLHHDRFVDRGGSDALHTEALRDFHRELSAIALKRGWLRLYVLWLDRKPAAALYGFRYGKSFLFYQAGFDRGFARHSVGLVAMGLAIRAAIEEGAQEFDLLHGDETYKSLWARSWRELERLEVFPPTAAGRAHRLLRRGARAARDVASAAPGERVMLRAAIKAAGAWALYSTGCHRVIGAARRVEQEPLVICYHRVVHDLRRHTWSAPAMLVTQRTLAAQLDWVGRRYQFVALDELAAATESGRRQRASARRGHLRRRLCRRLSQRAARAQAHGRSRHRLRGDRPHRHRGAAAPRPAARAAAAGQSPVRRDRDRLAARPSSARASALAA